MPVSPLSSRPMKNSADTVAVPKDHASAIEAKNSLIDLLHLAFMRAWKLQSSDSDDWLPSSWGYALAATSEEAIQLGVGASSKRLTAST